MASQSYKNLQEGLVAEVKRVREEVLPAYEAPLLQGVGRVAATFMRHDIADAEHALQVGDTVAMMRLFAKLQGYHT